MTVFAISIRTERHYIPTCISPWRFHNGRIVGFHCCRFHKIKFPETIVLSKNSPVSLTKLPELWGRPRNVPPARVIFGKKSLCACETLRFVMSSSGHRVTMCPVPLLSVPRFLLSMLSFTLALESGAHADRKWRLWTSKRQEVRCAISTQEIPQTTPLFALPASHPSIHRSICPHLVGPSPAICQLVARCISGEVNNMDVNEHYSWYLWLVIVRACVRLSLSLCVYVCVWCSWVATTP